VKDSGSAEIVIYDELEKNARNPYQMQNYLIYGESIKVNMENKAKY
jgi:hypothetical protein